ncbi:MAG: DUF1003 domain-containing protein [Bacteroidetes bacterium]|nr:DUF1003 domain-containing protein [Bacteroidota bacterium]
MLTETHFNERMRLVMGELSETEQALLLSLRTNLLTKGPDDQDEPLSRSQWLADRISQFGGSWTFIISFLCFIVIWMFSNIYLLSKPYDPYPFILLNLVLSCVAALQAPVIMMSQNRKEEKDRLRSINDYQVNLKAELEIRELYDKLDRVLDTISNKLDP